MQVGRSVLGSCWRKVGICDASNPYLFGNHEELHKTDSLYFTSLVCGPNK